MSRPFVCKLPALRRTAFDILAAGSAGKGTPLYNSRRKRFTSFNFAPTQPVTPGSRPARFAKKQAPGQRRSLVIHRYYYVSASGNAFNGRAKRRARFHSFERNHLARCARRARCLRTPRSPGSCDRSEFRGASNRRPSWQGSLRYPRSERRKNSLVEFSSQFRASGQETLKMQDECSNHEDGAGAGARGGGNTDAGEGWHG